MSINLHLKAEVEITIHNSKGPINQTMVNHFSLVQTPTEITEKILNSDDYLNSYLNWLKEIFPNDTLTYGIVRTLGFEDHYSKEEYEANVNKNGIPWEELEKVQTPSFRIEHEKELFDWLEEHDGWKIEWYGM